MFAPEIAHMLTPAELDRPRNALTMVPRHRENFGELLFYFEPVAGAEHTYTVASDYPDVSLFLPTQPIALRVHETIEMPSPDLLAIHRALAKILHASGAAEYIACILHDRDEGFVSADGSTQLGALVAVGLSVQNGRVRSH
jgi:hypothetical protein